MISGSRKRILISLGALVVIISCTVPGIAADQNAAATMVAATVANLQAGLAASETAQAAQLPPPTIQPPTPTASETPAATPTYSNPVVKTAALCWTGPGTAYPVVSSVKTGTTVELLGVASVAGWFVIKNPTYGDRCWIEAKNLQLDPLFSTAGLEVYNPPPTPGPKETPEPTETP